MASLSIANPENIVYPNMQIKSAMKSAMKPVNAMVIESRSGGWYICGVPGKRTVYGPFGAMMRATRQALKRVGCLPSWRVVVLDSDGSELVVYSSAERANEQHFN